MKISGVVKEIPRELVNPPRDGIHRFSKKDGKMKGCRSVMLNGKTLMPRGMTSFYIHNKKDTGIKVFYSFHHNKRCSRKMVRNQFKKHHKLYKLGVACKPYKIVEVKLDFDRYDKAQEFDHHVKMRVWGIKVEHVAYPEKVWAEYARGKAYDFKCLDQKEHPKHNPDGYLKFCKKMKRILKKAKIGVCGNYPFDEKENPKLGDVVYSTKKKHWRLVDCGQ